MKYRELISRLGVSDARFKFALRQSTKIIPVNRKNYEYSEHEFQLLRNYFDALQSVITAKINLGWSRSVLDKDGNKIHLPKCTAIKSKLILAADHKYGTRRVIWKSK